MSEKTKPDFFGAIIKFIRRNPVVTIAALAAVITSVIVPPDADYVGYFDFKTLTCLFCTLAVVCALKNIRFFYIIAERIVRTFKTLRASVLALVVITFVGSMLIANDMALLTFLPLGYIVLSATGKTEYMAFTFIMQNIAANLGGMLTPFGNPQNLYLYTRFSIPTAEFTEIMAPPFAAAVVLIVVCCLFLPGVKITVPDDDLRLPPARTALYLVLFTLSICIVFRFIPYVIGLVLIPAVLIFADRKALAAVDYPLLFTFAFFFIFAGNMSRIPAVENMISELLNRSVLLFSVASCQVISNVPSAILLSRFTSDYRSLLIGVNIGGTGTLIASLASVITFREYSRHNPDKRGRYMLLFSAFNFGFLILLTLFVLLTGQAH